MPGRWRWFLTITTPCQRSGMGRFMLLAAFWTCLPYNRTGCRQTVGNEMCSHVTCSFHFPLCRVLLFIFMFYIHLLNWLKFELFSLIFILNIFQSYAAVCICCHSPRLHKINIHRRGNILIADSKKAQVLCALTSSRWASVSFDMSVRFSSCIRRFSLNGFPLNLILETYTNICW